MNQQLSVTDQGKLFTENRQAWGAYTHMLYTEDKEERQKVWKAIPVRIKAVLKSYL